MLHSIKFTISPSMSEASLYDTLLHPQSVRLFKKSHEVLGFVKK